jgi:hypothetical protein
MKKTFFLWLFIIAAFLANGQGKTLYTVNVVKPKANMKSTFEARWKQHLAKFHKADDKRTVYEVMSGKHLGEFHIVEGPISYADMDKEKASSNEHSIDLEKNYFPLLEDDRWNGTYRWDDTASYNGTVKADKFFAIVTHIKYGQMPGTLREAKRTSLINAKLPTPSPQSSNTYFQIWSGSDPAMVTVINLKDGYKQFETDYFGPNPNPPNAFKTAYIKDYGQEAWDARSKLLDDNANIASRDVFIMRLRKDLSTQ